MPYIRKDELKSMLMSAFDEGVVAGVSINHSDNAPEKIFGTLDFDSLYQRYFPNQNNHRKTEI